MSSLASLLDNNSNNSLGTVTHIWVFFDDAQYLDRPILPLNWQNVTVS